MKSKFSKKMVFGLSFSGWRRRYAFRYRVETHLLLKNAPESVVHAIDAIMKAFKIENKITLLAALSQIDEGTLTKLVPWLKTYGNRWWKAHGGGSSISPSEAVAIIRGATTTYFADFK